MTGDADLNMQDSDNSYKPPTIIPWNPTGHVVPPSNVTRLSQALKVTDAMGRPQIAFYVCYL